MEKGENLISASNFQHSIPPRGYFWKLVAAFVAVLSVVALVTAIAALALQLTGNRRQEVAFNKQPVSLPRESELKEIAATISHHHQNQKTRRSVTSDSHGCVSSLDNTRTTKPTAHITGMMGQIKLITNLHFILSANWSCNMPDSLKSHVSGGMAFNRTTGFLRVPVSGYYNVYSQVLIAPINKSSSGFVFGHSTSYCTCLPDEPDCQCSVLEPGVGYIRNNELESNNLATSTTFNSRPQSSYHGGVFHLEAGGYLGVVVKLVRNEAPQVGFSTVSENSFLGAFLISEDTPPQPTPPVDMSARPTPSPSCICS